MSQPRQPSAHHPGNLVELLQRQADRYADQPAFTFCSDDGNRQSLSYRELDRRAAAIAADLQQQSVSGEPVLLVYPPGLQFIEAFLGCVYAGSLAVPATVPKPRRPLPRLVSIARDTGAMLALTDRQTLTITEQARQSDELSSLTWIATDQIGSDHSATWTRPPLSDQSLAFLQYTSGSTSEPRGVELSHGNLMHNLEMIRGGFGLNPDSGSRSGVFWLPAYHDMGLIGGILEPLYVGGHSVLMSPQSFLQRPIKWLKLLSEFRAQVSGAPNFAYDLCVDRTTPEQRAELDLSYLEVAFCGAEPIRPETLQRFAEAMAPAGFSYHAFYPCYGLAEATLLIAGRHAGETPLKRTFDRVSLTHGRAVAVEDDGEASAKRLVSCGPVLGDQQLQIVDPETAQPCQPGQVGEIWVRGPSVARGYWNQPELTESVFAAELADDSSKAFLRTGDLGFLDGGELFVNGRVKDVIIIRGRNHYPQDVEQTATESDPSLAGTWACAFGTGAGDGEPEVAERIVLVQELNRQHRDADSQRVIQAIRRSVSEVHEVDLAAVVLVRYASLPRTTSGKIQRPLCRQQYLDGSLKVRHQWRAHPAVPAADTGSRTADLLHAFQAVARELAESAAQDPQRLAERLERLLMNWLRDCRGVPAAELSAVRPFMEFGVDSLAAVELSQMLEDAFDIRLTPIIAWNYPTPRKLAQFLAEEVSTPQAIPSAQLSRANRSEGQTQAAASPRQPSGSGGQPVMSPDDGPAMVPPRDDPFSGSDTESLEAIMAELEDLSEEEAEAALKMVDDADQNIAGR